MGNETKPKPKVALSEYAWGLIVGTLVCNDLNGLAEEIEEQLGNLVKNE